MKVIINSVGANSEKISMIIKEVKRMDDEHVARAIKQINGGKEFSFGSLSDVDAIYLADRLTDAGAEVEIDEDTVVERLFDKLIKCFDNIFDWHEALYIRFRILALALFIIEAIIAILLVYNYWEVLIGLFSVLLIILLIVNVYTDKRAYTDEQRANTTKQFKKIGKWIVIGIVIFLLAKPASQIIINFLPGYPIRNSYLLMYSQDMTVEEAFDKSFYDARWSNYNDNGTKYVVYNGIRKNDETGKDEIWQFVFKVQGDGGVIDSIYANGIDVSWSEYLVLYGIYKRAGAIE